MGLSANQGKLLYLIARRANIESKMRSIQKQQTQIAKPLATKPARTSSEIKKELDKINKEIEATPKNYNVRNVTSIKYQGMVSNTELKSSSGLLLEGSVTLTGDMLNELPQEKIKNATVEKNEKYNLATLTFNNAQDYTELLNSIKYEKTEEIKELIITPELRELQNKQKALTEELDNALEYEEQQEILKSRENISSKNLPTNTLLANNGININFTNKTNQEEITEKTDFKKAKEEYEKAISAQQEAINKLNAFAAQNNFPRSTANLPGLAASQVRFEDKRAGRAQNFENAKKTNTPEYQEYQKLTQNVRKASKAVVEAKTKLENARSSALQKAKDEAELKFDINRIETMRKAIAENIDSTFNRFY